MKIEHLESILPNFKLKDSGWAECNCPWCGDTKAHLQISPDFKWVRCFKCGHSSPSSQLYSIFHINESPEDVITRYQSLEKKIKPILPLTEAIPFTEFAPAINYVESRGALDSAYYEKWMYAITGRFADRLIIPIHEHGILYGVIGRTLANSLPKYLFSTGFAGKELFYHYDFLFGKRIFILTEGVFDCITAQKALPFTGVISLFGKELSDIKAYKILKLDPQEIVIMLDSEEKDEQIFTSNQKLIKKLNILEGIKISLAQLPEGDANSLGELAIQESFYNRKEIR